VGKMSAMGQPTKHTQPSIPPGSVNVFKWITQVDTIKTAD